MIREVAINPSEISIRSDGQTVRRSDGRTVGRSDGLSDG